MHHYPLNSPEAAGRILAACLLTDGHLSLAELEALDRHGIEERLLLDRNRLLSVMQTLCEDLTRVGCLDWNKACQVDPVTLLLLAEDVQDPRMRRHIVELCYAAVLAEAGLCEREVGYLQLLCHAWNMAPPDRRFA